MVGGGVVFRGFGGEIVDGCAQGGEALRVGQARVEPGVEQCFGGVKRESFGAQEAKKGRVGFDAVAVGVGSGVEKKPNALGVAGLACAGERAGVWHADVERVGVWHADVERVGVGASGEELGDASAVGVFEACGFVQGAEACAWVEGVDIGSAGDEQFDALGVVVVGAKVEDRRVVHGDLVRVGSCVEQVGCG